MKKLFLIGITLLSFSVSAKETIECGFDLKVHGARYLVTQKAQGSNKFSNQYRVNLWRHEDQVAYEYPKKQLTEVWNLVSNGQIRPVRLFDKFKRGIEYQPLEVNDGKGDKDWSAKYQIVSQSLLEKLELKATKNDGCYTWSERAGAEKSSKVDIIWLEKVKLPKELTVDRGNIIEHWQLIDIEKDIQVVKRVFTQREKYQLTDYADIGDNESDPFLLKMLKIGFVSSSSPLESKQKSTRIMKSSHDHSHH
ncbi:MAG: hypothetical protein OQJ89_11070 [Kangiellaceae bacterium]|nr:hypothetical protein [Kangiellaceae bacterium]MCW8997405.1 hypothetical protein [Kangiellaceae bacterium]MCW9017498.1 hypothetical protein [Kangiellaceae bacterium]